MLFHQMTRVTKDKGALIHDDRLDALQMAVQYWVDYMAADAETAIKIRKEELVDLELEKFVAGIMGTENKSLVSTWM